MTPRAASRLKRLEVVGLTVRSRRRPALDAVTFAVHEGEVLALVGPPGAGKTVCLDCVAGAVRPGAGRVILDGRDVTGDSVRALARAGIVRAWPASPLLGRLTVRGNAMVALARRRVPMPGALLAAWRGGAARRKADAVLDRVGLMSLAGARAGLLPAGMLRRLQIALALAGAPRLVLMDEPLAGLAAEDAADVSALIERLRNEGLTMLLAARAGSVAAVADRVVSLDRGRVVGARRPARRPA